jgi:hypothetical protein
MKQLLLAVTALIASMLIVPAAQASDCDDDDAVELARCLARAKIPGARQFIAPPGRSPAAIATRCDPDEDDYQDCLRALKVPAARPSLPSGPRTVVEPKSATPSLAPPAADKSSRTGGPQAKAGSGAGTDLCKKYFPSIGQVVMVPCGE